MSLGCSYTSTQFNLLDWLTVRGRNRSLHKIQMASFILSSSTHIFFYIYILLQSTNPLPGVVGEVLKTSRGTDFYVLCVAPGLTELESER